LKPFLKPEHEMSQAENAEHGAMRRAHSLRDFMLLAMPFVLCEFRVRVDFS
jgi:hypothetical protein